MRLLAVLAGITLLSLGIAFMFRCGLGSDPWSVLAHGIAVKARIGLGLSSFLISVLCVVGGYAMGVKPGLGTVLTMTLVALAVRLLVDGSMIEAPRTLLGSLWFLTMGVLFSGFGIALYVCGNMGAGPRENLMFGVIRLTGIRIAIIRALMECSVTLVGFLIGGTAGLGTIAYAVSLGYVVERSFSVMDRVTRRLPALGVLSAPYSTKKSVRFRGRRGVIVDSGDAEQEAIMQSAYLMSAAAKTAPKACAADSIVTAILTGQEKNSLAELMRKKASEKRAVSNRKAMLRDALRVQKASAVFLAGIRGGTVPVGSLDCGACGCSSCSNFRSLPKSEGEDFRGPLCAFHLIDLGIALGSAAKVASALNIDNRILYTAGAAARGGGYLEADVIMGIALSVSAKNIFFDHGYPYSPEKIKELVEFYQSID